MIEPRATRSRSLVSGTWEYRDLLYLLARRDVAIRYEQAIFGVGWAVIQPVLMVVAFTIFLRRVVHLPSDGIPYPLFALAGLVPWTFFANAVGTASQSLVQNANLVSKVYFPRLVIPVASVLSWVLDMMVAFVILLAMMLFYRHSPSLQMLLVPAFVAFAVLAAMSIVVWLSALNVAYRDVRHAVPFVLQVWLFATPVVYSVSAIPERFRAAYGINPMAGAIEGFRWAALGVRDPHWEVVAVSAAATLVLLAAGLRYFRRVEQFFADVI